MRKNKKSILKPVLIILSVVGIMYCLLIFYLINQIKPVNKKNSTLQTIELSSGRIKTIAKELKEQGIIKNDLAFLLRAQLSGTAGKMDKGTYYLSTDMDVDKIISILSRGDHDNTQIVSVRIFEGDTVEDIADKLFEANVIYDKEAFLKECKEAKSFINNNSYSYLNLSNKDSKYIVEGFLFPDTYDFYYNSKPYDVIYKMLNRFNELFNAELQMKASALNLSTKDVITLASIIQKEANEPDFKKVSAVLTNRLKENMYLQCDSTIRYITNSKNTISLTKEQYSYNSPYNSYENKGLIPSPICNPSLNAIDAVLNPEQSFIDEKYLYFCSTNSDSLGLVFAKTYTEHLENVKKYKSSWQDYDNTIKNN